MFRDATRRFPWRKPGLRYTELRPWASIIVLATVILAIIYLTRRGT